MKLPFAVPSRNQLILTRSIVARLGFITLAIASCSPLATANPVVFGTPLTVTSDSDVTTIGSFVYGYTQSNLAANLNGVTFAAASSGTTLGGGNITLSGFGAANTTAFNGGAVAPWSGLSTDYRNLLTGAAFSAGATSATVTLNNLTAGHSYATQLWVNDARAGATATRTETVAGANTVTLDYNSTNAQGGVGQHVTGLFLADTTSQSFTMQGNASTQFNAIQLRDVTNLGAWHGTAGGTWDASSTANFATNFFNAPLVAATFADAKVPLGAVTFGDSYWDNGVSIPVTQNNITVASGGVAGGNVIFQNTAALPYTITSGGAEGISGATSIFVTGGGTVSFVGPHTLTGALAIGKGTVVVGSANTFNGTGTLAVSGSGVLDLNGFNAKFSGNSAGTGGSVTDNSAGSGTSTLSLLQTTNVGANVGAAFHDGATRVLAIEATNTNGGMVFNNAASTFSGGIKLLNTASGTRLTISAAVTTVGSPGAITSSNFGRGPITIGQAPTDRAGIFMTTGATVANEIIFNTALGTDRPGIRSDALNATYSGKITANLAPALFSSNSNGSFNLTGRVTGAFGLELDNQFGTTIAVTLNNATANPNDYQGTTHIEGAKGTLILGAANQIPNGAGKGNVLNSGTLRLNGLDEIINGLDGASTGIVDGFSGAPLLTLGDNNANGSYLGIIRNTAGNLALTKIGSGNQTLGGANTYTGATTIQSGKLVVTGSLAAGTITSVQNGATLAGTGTVFGSVLVNTGGKIESGNGIDAGTLTIGSVTLGSTLGDIATFNLRPFASPAVSISGTDAFIANGGTGSATVNVLGTAPALGTYTLIDYVGTALSPVAFGTFSLGALPNRLVAALVNNTDNTSIDLNVTLVDTARWSGASGSEWSTATITSPKNWVLNSNGSTVTDYLENDVVSFTDSATTTTLDISVGNVTPAAVTFNHTDKSYLITGTAGIGGTTGLTKVGGGTLTIANSNSFTGNVLIQQGVISVSALTDSGISGALGAGTAITLGDITTTGTLQFTGATGSSNRPITLAAGGGALDVAIGSTLTWNGTISGAAPFLKTGGGNLTLAAANTFTGGVVVSGGVLTPGNITAMGPVANSIAVTDGGSLNINSLPLQGYTQNISIAGAGAIPSLGALGNNGAVEQQLAVRGITLTANASVGGTGARWDIGRIDFDTNPASSVNHIEGGGFTLTKVGTNYLGLLTGASNLAGFVINGGIVAPHENTSFGTGPVTVNNGAIVQPWGGTTFNNAFTITEGTLQNDGFNDTYAGPLSIAGPTTLNPRLAGNIILNGNMSGSGAITKTGALSVLLGGDNGAYAGTYTQTQGNSFFTAASAGSSAASFVIHSGILGGRAPTGSTINLGSLSGTGGQLGVDVADTLNTFAIGGNGQDAVFSGAIVDNFGTGGTTAVTKVGAGSQTLNGVNTYTGATIIDAGTLLVNGSLTGSTTTVNAGGTLGGTGTVGAVSILGGSVAPGLSTGTLTTGSLTLDSDSDLKFELAIAGIVGGGVNDLLDVNGSLTLDGNLQVTELPGFGNGTYRLLDYTGTLLDLGLDISAFAAAHPGSVIDTSVEGEVNLIVVPEPGSAMCLLGGLGMLATLRRRSSRA